MGRVYRIKKQLQIAQCMHDLLSCSLDLKTGETIYADDSKSADIYAKLKELQDSLRNDVVAEKGYCGAYWWNVPWGDVLDVVQNSLIEEAELDGWRFETSLSAEQCEGKKLLYIQEDGVYSQFEAHNDLDYIQRPHYSQGETEQRLAKFNRELDEHADYKRFTVEGRVYSESSDRVYDSMNDYYMSSEYSLLRYRANEILKNSMYTPVETQRGTVVSHSIRYGALFSYGSYSTDPSGTLTGMEVRTFRSINARGTMSEYAGQALLDKCESVLCAAEIGRDPDVKAVPVEILDSVLGEERADFWEAVKDAAMLACIGNKLEGEQVQLPEHQFQNQAHYDHIVSIDAKVRQRQQMTTDALSIVLDALNKNLFRMEPIKLLEDKAMYMLLLSQSAEDDEAAIYWLELCAELAHSTGREHKSQRLLEYAVSAGAMLAEIRLQNKLKQEAERYALMALDSCEALRTVASSSPILTMEKMCQKFLKKARKKGLFF